LFGTLKEVFAKDEQHGFDSLPEGLTQERLVGLVDSEYKRRQQDRRPYEIQWQLNIAFIEGNQYLDINAASMSLEEVPQMYWWQEREVFNQIAPIIETRISRLSRMRPLLKVLPGTNEQEDVRASKVGTQLLKNVQKEQEIGIKTGILYAWMEACGTAFMKHIWNNAKGEVIAKIQAIDEKKQVREEEIREGDIDVTVVPPQEIFPDSSYRDDISNCKSIIHAKAFHIDDIFDIWGIEVDPEDVSAMQLQRSMLGIGGLGYGQGGFRFQNTRLKDHAIVKEYWERPSRNFPQGRLIIVCSGKLLYFGPLPYRTGDGYELDIPFTKVDCITRPGVFWGRTVVERLIPVQRRYNALRNRKAEYLNRVAIGQWIVEEESTDVDYLEQEAGAPGAIFTKKRGYADPHPVETPSLPAQFDKEEASLLNEFSMISGVSEISRQSEAPPGVNSGVALSIALEQDDTRLSSTAGNIENFFVQSGKKWLRLYKQFAVFERTLRSVGKNNLVEVMDWSAADIKSDDVIVEPFSAIVESPAQRRQMVFDLLKTGLFNDPETGGIDKETRHKILEMIELGHWESADDDDELHINKAERENRLMQKGSIQNVVNYDDHVLHVAQHNRFRLSTEYEELVRRNPVIDSIFQHHINIHLQYIMSSMQARNQEIEPSAS
jgi:hypothetical protein